MQPHLIIPYASTLIEGTLLRRRHRFIIDVRLKDGSVVEAHCANPGRMEGLVRPGATVFLSQLEGKGSLSYRWEQLRVGSRSFCTNSWIANQVARELVVEGLVRGIPRTHSVLREPKLGKASRADLLLMHRKSSTLVEVKSANLVYPDGIAYFPDSSTVRAVRQLEDVEREIVRGRKVMLIVVVIATKARAVRPSDLHDPLFSSRLRKLVSKGLQIRCVHFRPLKNGLSYSGEIPLDLERYDLNQLEVWRSKNKSYSGWERPIGNPKAAWRKNPVTVRRQTSVRQR